jgi:hypothetical protein
MDQMRLLYEKQTSKLGCSDKTNWIRVPEEWSMRTLTKTTIYSDFAYSGGAIPWN